MSPTEEDRSERSLVSAGHRRINAMWETTQALIALSGVGTVLFVSALLALLMRKGDVTDRQAAVAATAFMLLSNLGSLIIGFYFGRTNHTRVGGVPAVKSDMER